MPYHGPAKTDHDLQESPVSTEPNRLPRAALIALAIAVVAGLASLALPPSQTENPWAASRRAGADTPASFRFLGPGGASQAQASLVLEGRERLATPAGSVLCERYALRAGGLTLQRLWVEAAPRRSIIQVSRSDGSRWLRSDVGGKNKEERPQ